MVKGCQRRVIMMNNPPSRYFDSVCFILKSELPTGSRECDMLREAQLLIASEEEKLPKPAAPKRIRRSADGIIAYFSGAATVGLAAGAIALAAHFIF